MLFRLWVVKRRLGGLVTRAVQADDQAITDQLSFHVRPDAGEIANAVGLGEALTPPAAAANRKSHLRMVTSYIGDKFRKNRCSQPIFCASLI